MIQIQKILSLEAVGKMRDSTLAENTLSGNPKSKRNEKKKKSISSLVMLVE
jgi:hypothetical protein